MKEQTFGSQQPISAAVESEPPQPTAQDVIKPLEEASFEFDFWEDLKDSLPPWINEVVGFALIVFGILSFISLYIASDALVAVTWADMLTSLFGDGAIFIATTLFALGVVLWLPKVGIRIHLSSARLLAMEIIFLCVLAILHLAHSDSELRALVRAGPRWRIDRLGTELSAIPDRWAARCIGVFCRANRDLRGHCCRVAPPSPSRAFLSLWNKAAALQPDRQENASTCAQPRSAESLPTACCLARLPYANHEDSTESRKPTRRGQSETSWR